MAKKRTKFDEDDLKMILEAYMKPTWMDEDAHIVGIEYKTRVIKKGGDYYTDGVTDKDYPGEVEVIKSIKVLTETGRRKKEETEEPPDDVE